MIVHYCDTPEEFRDGLVEELTIKIDFLDSWINRKTQSVTKPVTPKKEVNARIVERNTLRAYRDTLVNTHIRPKNENPFVANKAAQ
jgi:hypothetical protein